MLLGAHRNPGVADVANGMHRRLAPSVHLGSEPKAGAQWRLRNEHSRPGEEDTCGLHSNGPGHRLTADLFDQVRCQQPWHRLPGTADAKNVTYSAELVPNN